jgi:hypothetical protein
MSRNPPWQLGQAEIKKVVERVLVKGDGAINGAFRSETLVTALQKDGLRANTGRGWVGLCLAVVPGRPNPISRFHACVEFPWGAETGDAAAHGHSGLAEGDLVPGIIVTDTAANKCWAAKLIAAHLEDKRAVLVLPFAFHLRQVVRRPLRRGCS